MVACGRDQQFLLVVNVSIQTRSVLHGSTTTDSWSSQDILRPTVLWRCRAGFVTSLGETRFSNGPVKVSQSVSPSTRTRIKMDSPQTISPITMPHSMHTSSSFFETCEKTWRKVFYCRIAVRGNYYSALQHSQKCHKRLKTSCHCRKCFQRNAIREQDRLAASPSWIGCNQEIETGKHMFIDEFWQQNLAICSMYFVTVVPCPFAPPPSLATGAMCNCPILLDSKWETYLIPRSVGQSNSVQFERDLLIPTKL